MYRHSLRKRVAIAFAACVAVLSVVWGFAFFAAIKLSEDRVLVHQLQRAVASYPSVPVNLRGYEEVARLPDPLKRWAQTDPDMGIYEFEQDELHVAVIPAENAQRRAFVVFDVAGIEADSSEDWWWLLVITGVVGTLGILGFGLGIFVMRRAVAPVAQLANMVADIDPEQLSAEDHQRIASRQFGDDEVGVLARTIEKTLERISAFVDRERYFTSSASHELRTPITVITGALELLEQGELSVSDREALNRAKRATNEMKTTIEMFLWLARESDSRVQDEEFLVMPLVTHAVELQRYLKNRHFVDVDIEDVAKPKVIGHPQAFSIAVNNLVRNAFEHSLDAKKPITIRVQERELVIINQVSNVTNKHPSVTDAASQGYGLGLGIVQRLCERSGWSFSLRADNNQVVARLAW